MNARQKALVFLSSRMSYVLDGKALKETRQELKSLLEAAYPFLAVELAEDWTAGRKGSPRELSREGGSRSDLFIVILVDSAGYLDDAGLGATEIEINGAIEDSWDKVLVFVHESLPSKLERLPDSYRKLVQQLMDYEEGKNVALFSDHEDLMRKVVSAVAGHCAVAVKRFSARVSGKSGTQAEWELMTFTERFLRMQEAFRTAASGVAGVTGITALKFVDTYETQHLYRLTFREAGVSPLPIVVSACPDRFSFPEAARFVGYPFRTVVGGWQKMVKKWPLKSGPLHVVLIYRTITDTQVRRHLGNPDIRVAREPWGFFARDPETLIQSLYLANCQDPVSLRERVHDGLAWLSAADRLAKIVQRAEGHGKILEARQLSLD